MTTDFDVAVLGGGPAGAAVAGLLARKGVNVVLIEQTSYASRRVGESLAPAFIPLLARLGLDQAMTEVSHFHCPGIISVWGSAAPMEHDFIRMPFGYGMRLDRQYFDRSLAQLARVLGCLVLTDTAVYKVEFAAGSWHLGLQGPAPRAIKAGFLVDATGSRSFRVDGPVRWVQVDRLVALVSVSRGTSVNDRRVLIEASRSGWWYSALLPRDELLVSYFTDYDLLEHGHHDLRPYLAAAPFTAERVGKDQLETPSIHNAPSRLRAKIKGNAWLSVGDSASTFDPVSGQGICKALAQAELAANAITSTLDGKHGPLDDYEQVVRAGFSEYLVQRHDYYQAERRWRNMPFWERRT